MSRGRGVVRGEGVEGHSRRARWACDWTCAVQFHVGGRSIPMCARSWMAFPIDDEWWPRSREERAIEWAASPVGCRLRQLLFRVGGATVGRV